MTEQRKFGGYSEVKQPSEDSKQVLENVFQFLVDVDLLKMLQKEHLLNNHSYTTQVVAGKNYNFTFSHEGSDYSLIVWKKLNGTHSIMSIKKIT